MTADNENCHEIQFGISAVYITFKITLSYFAMHVCKLSKLHAGIR